MKNRLWSIFALIVTLEGMAAAQAIAPGYIDPRPVLEAVSKTMGADKLKCVTYSGAGQAGVVGQNRRPVDDWPRVVLTSYSRTINYDAKTSKEEEVRKQDEDPDLAKETTLTGTGVGTPVPGGLRQLLMINGNYAWNMQGNNAIPEPTAAEQRQLDIWLTPHGFIKAALTGKTVAANRWEEGRRTTVVSTILLGKYRANATINEYNVIERVQTWVPDSVLGDIRYDHYYSRFKDFGGVLFPTRFHHHYGPDDELRRPNWLNGYNAFNMNVKDVQINACGDPLTVPDAVRTATIPPVRVEPQKMADGVWYLGGASHNSVAVEFKNFAAVIEAPLNEDRSIAVISEVNKLIPNKQIRYVVATHNHFDHIGGLRTYAHEGTTIIAHEFLHEYLWHVVLGPEPWTLKPDKLSLFPPEEILDTGFVFETVNEKITVSDENRLMDVYHVYGGDRRNCRNFKGVSEECNMELEHSPYMLMVYLPKEKILVEADLFNPPPLTTPESAEKTFYYNVKRLGLDVATIAPIHGHPVPWSDFEKVASKFPLPSIEYEMPNAIHY